MIRAFRPSRGLLGQILTVLLLTVLVEFGASTLLYERTNSFTWREDEAHRLAEHLVIARKLLAERPAPERPAIAEQLSTDRYDIDWIAGMAAPAPAPQSADLAAVQREIVAWERGLARTNLRLSLPRFGLRSTLNGGLQLPDRSWMHFAAHGDHRYRWDLAIGRILIALIPAAALMLIGALLIRRMLQPLQHLAEATARIGTSAPVLLDEEGTPEVRGLIRAFNAMQGRIHRLLADRIQALAAVGHDLRTPLARVELRLDGIGDAQARREIGRDIAEIDAMIASLLAFIGGEDDPETQAAVDLAVLIATIVDDAADRGGDATYAGPDHLVARVRPIGMRRAVTNLVENALRYGERARVSLTAGAGRIAIAVEDEGPGIPPESLEAVRSPFVRLDAARARSTEGMGLGLAIVERAVTREGGTLVLANREGGGLRAEIGLRG